MKRNKFLSLAMALVFATSNAFAASIGDDNVDLGKTTSTGDKSITFKGPTSSKKLKGSQAGALGYNGNSLSIGDGANTANKTFTFDKGGSSPFFQYNFSTGAIDTGNLSILNHTGNNLYIGDGTNTNKVLKFNKGASSPEIRFNSTTSKLEFSNDASLYKAIGSGTGSGGDGGKNLLTNVSFEDGISLDWSNTGGTFTQGTYTNGTEDDAKYANFVATTTGQYFETALKSVPDSLGVGCMADIKYFGGSGNFKIQALDASANLLAEAVLPNTTSWQKSFTLAYPCPTAGATMRLRVISTAAGTIQADLGYLGGNKNISQIAQASIVGEAKIAATTSCIWSRNSTSQGAFSTVAACPGPTVVTNPGPGTIQTTDTDLPQFTVNNLPPGTYEVEIGGQNNNDAGAFAMLSIFDGTTRTGEVGAGNSTSATHFRVKGIYTYTTTGNRTFALHGATSSGNVSVYANQPGPNNNLQFIIKRFPLDSEQAVTVDQSQWHIDANIGGANTSFTTTQSTYTEITNASLDLVLNTSKGSASAEIPCSSTNPSTGLTCAAGNEGLGIVFTPPYAGLFEVCADATVNTTNGESSTLQLVETPNNAQTILQEGGQRTDSGFSVSTGSIDTSFHICGTFNFGSVSKKTIRLMYEKPTSSTTTFIIDRSGTAGQRDMKITVRPVLQNVARPVLTGDQVTTPNAASPRVYALEFGGASRGTSCTSTPCTLHFNPGNWVTSVTRNSAGNYTVNIPSTTFGSGAYTCTCSTAATSAGCQIFGGTPGATSFNVFGASGADNSLALMCLGLKP